MDRLFPLEAVSDVPLAGDLYEITYPEKRDGCGDCARRCPEGASETATDLTDFEQRKVVAVTEELRNRIKSISVVCEPERRSTPCHLACSRGGISFAWNPA